MNGSATSKHSNSARTFWKALPLGLALAVPTRWDAAAQLAVDKVHVYAIGGYATFTPNGTGHTGHTGKAG